METHILWLQAQILRWVGLGFLATGLWLGTDPLTVAWRAALAAVIATVAAGWGLRQIAAVMEERIAADLAEAQLAAESAEAQAAAKTPVKPPNPNSPGTRPTPPPRPQQRPVAKAGA